MAASTIETAREAAMAEDLSRFWSTMSRKYEWDRPHHKVYNSAFGNYPRATPEDTWDNLVAEDTQDVPTPSYLKVDSKETDVQGLCSTYETDFFKSGEDLLDCELGSGQIELDWVSYQESQLAEEGRLQECPEKARKISGLQIEDAPTQYVITGLKGHEHPVIGTYVDPLIVTGFSYTVRPTDSKKLLFKGQALQLISIGRGYGKRLTFASDCLNENENYFWSDSNPEGYGFGLSLVQEEEKFMLRDANDNAIATAEVAKIVGPQKEVGHRVLKDGSVEKKARVSLFCKVHYFHLSHADPKLILISGVAVSVKPKGSRSGAALQKIIKCSINGERGFTLIAGVDTSSITTVVNGEKAGDIPIQYTITGLQSYEMPVVGTYVDPRILTGFKYRVRPADSKKHLFKGSALTLQSIGRGYGKRLTFAGNKLNENENYFWSDTNPEGYGFSIQAVFPGDTFSITNSLGENLGRAQVFRADAPQVEERTETSSDGRVTKRVRVTVTCDVSFHGEDDQTIIVTGTAIVVRRGREARVQRMEDVAVSSMINLIFTHENETLTFLRE